MAKNKTMPKGKGKKGKIGKNGKKKKSIFSLKFWFKCCCENVLCCCLKCKKKSKLKNTFKPESAINKWRLCTDCCMVPIFLLFWVGMILVSVYGFTRGNPATLIEPTDYANNMCGFKKNEGNNNKYNLESYKYLWYPFKLSIDLSKVQILDAYYLGICVSKCPNSSFSLEKNTGFVCDYDYKDYEELPNLAAQGAAMAANSSNNYCQMNNFATSAIGKRCIPTFFNSTNWITEQFYNVYNWIVTATAESYTEFLYSYTPLIITGIVSFFICFFFIFVVSVFTPIVVVVVIISVFVLILLVAGYCIVFGISNVIEATSTGDVGSRNAAIIYLIIGSIASLALIIYVFLVLFLLKRVRLAIAIIQESSKAAWAMPTMFLVPLILFFFLSLNFIWYVVVFAYIQSATSPLTVNINADDILSNFGVSVPGTSFTIERGNWIHYLLHGYHLFGFLWTMAFIFAFGYMVIAMCVVYWYFSSPPNIEQAPKLLSKCDPMPKLKKLKCVGPCINCCVKCGFRCDILNFSSLFEKPLQWFPVTRAFFKVGIFHTGSVLFGSLLVAIVQMIRIIVRQVEKQIEMGKKKKEVTFALKVLQVIIWIFEQLVKFINKNAYIMICIKSDMFVFAAFKSFTLILSNILRVVTTNFIGEFILILGQIVVTLFGGLFCYFFVLYCNRTAVYIAPLGFKIIDGGYFNYGIVPAFVAAFISFIIAALYFSVYGTIIDTLLLCFCADLKYCGKENKPHYFTKGLADCTSSSETNDKFNKSIKKEIKRKENEIKRKEKEAKRKKEREMGIEMKEMEP